MVHTQLTWYEKVAISQHIPHSTGQDATLTTINTHTLEYLKLTSQISIVITSGILRISKVSLGSPLTSNK
jgi:hypothetical protein